ncbi:MAG: cytochrome c [Lautropia sp.]
MRFSPTITRWAPALRAPRLALLLVAGVVAGASPVAFAQSRGELLYENACRACHDEQVHWRANRLATDWSSLEDQVRRWQSVGRLNWSDDDIRAVARHLNERIYRFDPGAPAMSRLAPGTSRPAIELF